MNEEFLTGVIEGFYGQPWSREDRLQLLEWMEPRHFKAYLYAPKDDLKLRARWREPYTANELSTLTELINLATARGIEFIYALSPGLDIQYSSTGDLEAIQRRFQQLIDIGARSFALLFDDIPDAMQASDREAFSSFAVAQAHVANEVFFWLRNQYKASPFAFCPTAYCGRMAANGHGGAGYLEMIGGQLHPTIQVFWTGPEIVSDEISVRHIRDVATLLRRKPLLWDNLHANDYDGSRFYVGPYSGRSRELLAEVSGIFTNPNCELHLNYLPLTTLSDFVHGEGDWNPRASYLTNLNEWRKLFDGQIDDLVLLFDCYYLPHEIGPEAERLLRDIQQALATPTPEVTHRLRSLRSLCARLSEIENRPLFYALSRRIWDLREELDLLLKFIEFRSNPKNAKMPFESDFHLPKTYRGGFIPVLRKLLQQNPDGTFMPNLNHE